ncbi:MAG: alpha-galactosidase [Bacteroidales bacterium]|nr:alpha-galactosidase [Bacteroidales bacterium]
MRKLAIISSFVLLTIASCAPETTRVRPPLMGWNSWNAYMVDISDSIIMNAADMMVAKGLKAAGYDHVNIDDGYFGHRDSAGYMIPHQQRFPKGMAHVPEYIHSLGMKAGIYSDAGNNTCGSFYNHDENGLGAGLWQHEIQDAERYFNDWGFDFIKIDYCGGQKQGLDEEETYTRIREIIDSVANKHINISVCRWSYPGTWVKNVGSSWRISNDIRPSWKSICKMIEKNLYLSAYAGDGGYNDLDMLVVGYNGGKDSAFGKKRKGTTFGLTYAEEEAHFTMWCALSSPLLIGCDLTYIPQETIDIITNPELIAVNQDGLGLQSHVIWHDGKGYVFAKDIEKLHGEVRAVTLFNPTDSSMTFTVPSDIMGFNGQVSVRDLNTREDLGTLNEIEFTMPAHSAKLLRVEGKRVDAQIYEAEWAYVPAYSGIAEKRTVTYDPYEGASCCAVASDIGGHPDKNLTWKDVYCTKGGKYAVTVHCKANDGTAAELLVNGKKHCATIQGEGMTSVSYLVNLKKGSNVITFGNQTEVISVVDCMTLEKVE